MEAEDGAAVNVCIGLCVLAGIAAGDTNCVAATGLHYSGPDHSAAADYLSRIDSTAGAHLRTLVGMKPGAHYGNALLRARDRTTALRAATALVESAQGRTR